MNGAVEERFAGILRHLHVVTAALSTNQVAGVEGGRGDHAKHFARRWLDGHDAAYLVFHQPFAQRLQFHVDAEVEVFARHGGDVLGTIHVVTLDLSMGIAEQNFASFYAAQFLFIETFHALLADEITAAVVVVGGHLLLRYLT